MNSHIIWWHDSDKLWCPIDSQTHWLSVHSWVARLIEQREALVQYFLLLQIHRRITCLSLKKSNVEANYIFVPWFFSCKSSQDWIWCFRVQSVNTLSEFQFCAIHKEFSSCYLRESCWKLTSLQNIDLSSQANFLPLSKVYIWIPKKHYVCQLKNVRRECLMFGIF